MKGLILSILLIVLASPALAQQAQLQRAAGATATKWKRHIIPSPQQAQPRAENVKFFYYDDALPTRAWPVPAEFTPLLVVMYGQRVTLERDYGFVDSIRIRLGATQGDSIVVSLMHDTLFEVADDQFAHLIDIFEEGTDYARVTAAMKDTMPGGWLTVHFPHAFVRKEFFVVAEPQINDAGQAVSAFEVIGDVREPAPLTTEGSRSAFVSITPQNFYLSALLDGVVQFDGEDQPAYTNFYIEAYVDVTSLSVRSIDEPVVAVYPNPARAGASLEITSKNAVERIEIRNVLGVPVHTSEEAQNEITLPQLPAGMYHILITTDAGVTVEKLIVE